VRIDGRDGTTIASLELSNQYGSNKTMDFVALLNGLKDKLVDDKERIVERVDVNINVHQEGHRRGVDSMIVMANSLGTALVKAVRRNYVPVNIPELRVYISTSDETLCNLFARAIARVFSFHSIKFGSIETGNFAFEYLTRAVSSVTIPSTSCYSSPSRYALFKTAILSTIPSPDWIYWRC
jgi:hypothetical protein